MHIHVCMYMYVRTCISCIHCTCTYVRTYVYTNKYMYMYVHAYKKEYYASSAKGMYIKCIYMYMYRGFIQREGAHWDFPLPPEPVSPPEFTKINASIMTKVANNKYK